MTKRPADVLQFHYQRLGVELEGQVFTVQLPELYKHSDY